MVAETDATGVHLVAIDEHGDRQLELLQPAEAGARDLYPAISPDCKWLAFASSRGRKPEEPTLWIAPLADEATPVQLTTGPGIDTQPAWTPDGKAIVFASTRDGNFELYRLPMQGGRASGAPERITTTPAFEQSPAVAPDGTIYDGLITPLESGGFESHIERQPSTPVTGGPADTAPGISRDGKQLVFSRPNGRADADLWMQSGDAQPQPLLELPYTDEGGPTWSRDGRFLFATSRLVGADGRPLFLSAIVIDLAQHPPVARILEDHASVTPRAHPAIGCVPLDASALDANPVYGPELLRIIENATRKQLSDEPPAAPSPRRLLLEPRSAASPR